MKSHLRRDGSAFLPPLEIDLWHKVTRYEAKEKREGLKMEEIKEEVQGRPLPKDFLDWERIWKEICDFPKILELDLKWR